MIESGAATVTESLPTFERSISIAEMHRYGAATWDSHRQHYDLDYVASKKLPAPIADGQMLGALLAGWVQDYLGPEWRLSDLSYRFATFVFADQPVRFAGAVTGRTPDRVTIEARVTLVEPDGADGAEVLRRVSVQAVHR